MEIDKNNTPKILKDKIEEITQAYDFKINYNNNLALSSSTSTINRIYSENSKFENNSDFSEVNSTKKFKDLFKWFNKFDLRRDLLKQSWTNYPNFHSKKRQKYVSYELHFYIYVLLFNIWWIAKIVNQISHVENSLSFNDSRLSNIMSIVNDILHTFYTAIPLFCPIYKYWEKNFEKIDNSVGIKEDEYIFAFLSIYILLAFFFHYHSTISTFWIRGVEVMDKTDKIVTHFIYFMVDLKEICNRFYFMNRNTKLSFYNEHCMKYNE